MGKHESRQATKEKTFGIKQEIKLNTQQVTNLKKLESKIINLTGVSFVDGLAHHGN